MRSTTLSCALLPALAALPAVALPSPQTRGDGQGSLRKVEPTPAEEPDPGAQVFSRAFDPEEWKKLLANPDLERRERSLDELLARARLDPVARAFLEELARDPDHGELAWTARLALRELGRARFPILESLPGDPFQMRDRVNEMLRDLWSDFDGRGFFARPHGLQLPAPAQPPGKGSACRVEVEQSERGARVEITESVDGEEQKRTYEGASLAEILRKNPDLAKELEEGGVSLGEGTGGFDLRFDLDPRRRRWSPFEGQDGQVERQLGRGAAPQGRSRPKQTDVLGVIAAPLPLERAQELGLEPGNGLEVRSTLNGSYAHLLGVRRGDVLLELNGVTLESDEDIARVMRARAPEDELTLTWIDDSGQRRTGTWRLDKAR